MIQPLPGGAMVLLGVSAAAVTGVLTPQQALAGHGDPIVWLRVVNTSPWRLVDYWSWTRSPDLADFDIR